MHPVQLNRHPMTPSIENSPPTPVSSLPSRSPPLTHTTLPADPAQAPLRPLSVYYQNARGIRTKTNDFVLATSSSDYDVIVLTETWLHSGIKNSELAQNYSIYRCDRSQATSQFQRGGGVLIAVKSSLQSVSVQLNGCDSLEQVAVKISLAEQSVFVCGIYLRPNSEPERYIRHAQAVQQILDTASACDAVVVVGDYNLPDLTWTFDEDLCGFLPSNASTEQELAFTEHLMASGLLQLCDVRNVNGRLLDLAFVRSVSIVEVIEAPSPILKLDRNHTPFVLRLDLRQFEEHQSSPAAERDFNFNRCDYNAVRDELNSKNWLQLFDGVNVNAAVSVFYDEVFDIISRHTSVRRPFSRRSYRQDWWNADLSHRRNVLRKARRRFFRHRSPANRILLQRLEADYNDCVSAAFREYVLRIEDDVRSNPSSFWKFIKTRKSSNSIPSELSFDGVTSRDTPEAAKLFSDFFKSVYTSEAPPDSSDLLNSLPTYNINLVRPTFSIADVEKALSSIDPSKGPGPDKLPPAFVKQCANALAIPVSCLFNRSLSEGLFPDAWKLAAVTPIFKSGNIHNVENYRPISILCCLSKILESLIHEKMYNAAKPIISEFQHGFVKNRSTTTNLMSYVSTLNTSLENRCQVDSIYIDFSKAFDKVPHELTLKKLDRLGFPGWLMDWLRSYLCGRSAYVKLGSVLSRSYEMPSGVPQGSHLGPLIFILFVNDLCNRLQSNRLMYADDLKIFRVIRCLADCVALQQDLDIVSNWCVLNGMAMNATKCKVMSFRRSRPQITLHYSVNSVELDRVSSITDLGVTFNSKLNFNEHISRTSAKAFAVLGFIRRNCAHFQDVYALKSLYCSLVRSILEYGVQVWAPYQAVHASRMERVQRSFVRYALRRLPWNDPLRLPPYEHRCQLINLEPLSQRRDYLQRLFTFDIISNRLDCPHLLQQVNFHVPARRTRQQQLLWIPRHRTVFGRNHPLHRCLRKFNEVSRHFDFNVSRDRFKFLVR